MTMFAVVFTVDTPKEVHALGVVTTSITLVYQHYDTTMHCNPCGGSGTLGPHPWNHARGTDGIYGNLDDCPHCSCYCAPASISMIALYRGLTPPVTYQDDIYDSGELELGMGEATGDKIIDRHGVGMCDGTGLPFLEVQIAFAAALGGFVQHDHGGLNSVLTQAQLRQYIVTQHPVLWLDHNGWPANMSTAFPTGDYRSDQGHAKVIAGYDDNATADFIDDLCLIYDPWPEYNDLGVTPVNATKGPGGTYDPYWLPLNDVNLSDTSDIYLVDTYPDIPEFGTVLVPVLGLVLIAVVLSWKRRKGDGKRSEMGPCSDPESRI
ncbi:MAG: hypothetical protein JSU93_05175 [Methanobacteriota archaeon]|nr:MAG: hypothetical protein JSU93_05175 [Euryarchaeota archaeon]